MLKIPNKWKYIWNVIHNRISFNLIIEFSVRIASEERHSYCWKQLLTNQFQTTLQSVGYFGFGLICDHFHSTTTDKQNILVFVVNNLKCNTRQKA